MEPTKYRRRNDVATGVALGSEWRCSGRALTDRPVRPPAVEKPTYSPNTCRRWRSLKISTRARHSVLADLTHRSIMALERGDLKGDREPFFQHHRPLNGLPLP